MKVHREVERKYEVGDGEPVPDLTELPQVATVEPPREIDLVAVYFDTEGLDLARAGVTLRRRTGGDDEGWHLKLPRGPGEREEFAQPLRRGASTVPKALRSLVQVQARGRRLLTVATVRNRRVAHRLLAEDGSVLAEFCDDNVTAEAAHDDGSVTTSVWREWEIELVHGPLELLAATDDLVLAAGGRAARTESKLARAVGTRASRPILLEEEPTKLGPSGLVVVRHLRDQVVSLQASDPRVRLDQPDAVHKMRVATRRLRSALTTFGPLLDPQAGHRLRVELKWLAGALGLARDAEVMRDRLTAMVADDVTAGALERDGESRGVSGTLDGGLVGELEARYRSAHAEVLRVLGSARYFRLLDSLDGLLDSPPWTGAAELPARELLPDLVRRDWRRTRKRARAAAQAATPAERDSRLHELRKAAKRLRYACEALTPVFGDDAEALGQAARQLQEVLGDHQDSVVSQELLRELANHASLSGDVVLLLGRLHLLEQAHAERTEGHYRDAWKRVSGKRRRRWLKP